MTRGESMHAVLAVLAENPHRSMHRLDIGAAIYQRTGGTFLASVIGTLLTLKLISRPVPDPGPKVHRYRITDAGLKALELFEVFEPTSEPVGAA